MGCVILTKLAYKDVKYELCESNDINERFKYFYTRGLLYKYDKIYITDIHLNKLNLDLINADNTLKYKLYLFDHNESVTSYNDLYDFVNITIKENGIYTCATSLVYEHLLNNNLLKRTNALDTFCQAIRNYDTGIWKFKDKKDIGRNLSILFNSLGATLYIKSMYKKLNRLKKNLVFNHNENKIITIQYNLLLEHVLSFVKELRIKRIQNHMAGIVFIPYDYRNEVAQYLREVNPYGLDYVLLISLEKKSISIRNINPEINVRPIAEQMGGKGHFAAAGCYIQKSNENMIIRMLR